MKIPTGNFGFDVQQPVTGGAQVQGAGAVGQSLNRLGDVGNTIATNALVLDARAAQKQKSLDDELAKAKTANALLDHELYLKESSADIADKVTRGEIPYTDAIKTFDEVVSKAPKYEVPNGDPVLTENFQRGLKRATFGAQVSVQRATEKAKSADYESQFAAGLDKIGKLAGMPGADVEGLNQQADGLRIIAQQAGMPEDKISKSLQDFKDRNWYNQAQLLQNTYSDNRDGLDRLKGELTKQDGFYADKLDPERRTSLIKSIDGRIEQLDTRAQHLADKREAKAQKALEEIDKQVSSTVPATADQWLQWSETIKGTPYEKDFKERVNDEREVQSLLRKPIEEQNAYLQQKQQDMAANGGDLRAQANLKRLQSAVDQNTKLLKEQPLIFNQNRTGMTVEPLNVADMGTPGGMGKISAQLKDRFATVSALRKRYGQEVSLNPWLPQESAMLKQLISKSDNTTKLATLGMIAAGSPDAASYTSALRAVAADKPALMLAGLAQYRQLKSTEGRDIAQTILEGDRILSDKSVIMPTENAFRAAFEQQLGTALPDGSPQREQAYIAFKSMYAGMANEMGVRHVNEDKNAADEKVARVAINLATGGITDWNGKNVIRPYGMPEDKFKDGINASLEGIAKANDYSVGDLNDLPLMQVPGQDGSYYLMNGNKAVPGRDGKPVIVNSNGSNNWGSRPDGSQKGNGFLGVLKRPDGGVMTEYSVGVNINGKEMDIPTLVPTLSKSEINILLNSKDGEKIPESIIKKAEDHAKKRIKEGKPVFATASESPRP
ncbi:MAG TPA: hypothetical protein VN023_09560 [Methylovorus sp.]|nr:hypothetical protein [Methylovorus sp.]